MVFAKYSYPLPNNGSGYSFTEQELIKLLDSVYNKGFSDGVQVATPPEVTCASSSSTRLTISLRNDKEVDWTRKDFPLHTGEQSVTKGEYKMTNLDIIKHLALNNPSRLAELLDDIYCCAWNCGSYAGSSGEGKILEECEMEFTESEWLNQDADTDFFLDCELREWSRVINKENNQ